MPKLKKKPTREEDDILQNQCCYNQQSISYIKRNRTGHGKRRNRYGNTRNLSILASVKSKYFALLKFSFHQQSIQFHVFSGKNC